MTSEVYLYVFRPDPMYKGRPIPSLQFRFKSGETSAFVYGASTIKEMAEFYKVALRGARVEYEKLHESCDSRKCFLLNSKQVAEFKKLAGLV